MLSKVKRNVGHSEGASGITSIIKSALALDNLTIPPNIHFQKRVPAISSFSLGQAASLLKLKPLLTTWGAIIWSVRR